MSLDFFNFKEKLGICLFFSESNYENTPIAMNNSTLKYAMFDNRSQIWN